MTAKKKPTKTTKKSKPASQAGKALPVDRKRARPGEPAKSRGKLKPKETIAQGAPSKKAELNKRQKPATRIETILQPVQAHSASAKSGGGIAAATQPLTREQKLWRWRILASTYLAYGGFYLTRKVFTICKTTIAKEFEWELADTGNIWATFLIAYMLGQFVNSFVGRKWGPRVLLLGGLLVSMLCNVVFGFANSYYTFIVFMFFNGLVQAAGWPGAVGGIAEWLRPRERGTIMGVWSTSYLVGNMVVKSLGGFLLGHYGWRWSFFGCTMLTVIIWFIVYFWQRDKPEDVGLSPIVYHNPDELRTVTASAAEHISMRDYIKLALNPVVLAMGASYFCIKFLRYALDSWLPAFLNVKGMDVEHASYYSQIFDFAGLAGAVIAGWALDRFFRGNWAIVCFIMGLGMITGYILVIQFGANPIALSICFGLVGFMIYGPDTILCGAASVEVAGEKNAVAVAGIVNGLASIGPVVQEKVISWLIRGDVQVGMRNTNLLALSMSVLFAILMLVLMLRIKQAHAAHLQKA